MGAKTCEDLVTNTNYILVLHESLHYRNNLDHILKPSNELLHCDIPFWGNPYDHNRGINLHESDEVTMTIQYQVNIVMFYTITPMEH